MDSANAKKRIVLTKLGACAGANPDGTRRAQRPGQIEGKRNMWEVGVHERHQTLTDQDADKTHSSFAFTLKGFPPLPGPDPNQKTQVVKYAA